MLLFDLREAIILHMSSRYIICLAHIKLILLILIMFSGQLRAQSLPPAAQSPRPHYTADVKTTGTKATPEEKPHVLLPIVWGDYQLQFGGDTRIRGEDRHNYDMKRATADNDSLGFLRTRLNWDLTWCSVMRAFVEVSDSREIGAREFQSQEDYLDLHQAFIEYKAGVQGPWGVRLGKQEMDLGRDHRLLEETNWSDLRRTFDGARVMYRSEDVDNDTFLFHPEYYEHQNDDEIVTRHSRPRKAEWFYGSYFTMKQFKPHTLEAYFLGLSDTNSHRTFPKPVKSEEQQFGTTDRYTIGSALYGPLWTRPGCGTLSYNTDGAWQFGHRAEDEIRAWMLHGDVSYQWDEPMAPKLSLIGNIATGDRKKGDGETNTFNPLFGATHAPYGIIDFARLQNLRELALTGSVEPTSKTKAQLELHRFWLESATDAWYDSRGNSIARDATGRSGTGLGYELDAILTYKMTKFVTLECGLAHFIPNGDFAQKTGHDSNANLLYLQTIISF